MENDRWKIMENNLFPSPSKKQAAKVLSFAAFY
jgi:hypothetical protein